jgi:hypothetical protein
MRGGCGVSADSTLNVEDVRIYQFNIVKGVEIQISILVPETTDKFTVWVGLMRLGSVLALGTSGRIAELCHLAKSCISCSDMGWVYN